MDLLTMKLTELLRKGMFVMNLENFDRKLRPLQRILFGMIEGTHFWVGQSPWKLFGAFVVCLSVICNFCIVFSEIHLSIISVLKQEKAFILSLKNNFDKILFADVRKTISPVWYTIFSLRVSCEFNFPWLAFVEIGNRNHFQPEEKY